jgi:hypothetical protein
MQKGQVMKTVKGTVKAKGIKFKTKAKVKLVGRLVNQKNHIFKPDSIVSKIEKLMSPDAKTGVSEWFHVDFLSPELGIYITGNGCSHLRSDGPLGKKYIIERVYGKNNRREVEKVRFAGYKQRLVYNTPSRKEAQLIKQSGCALCGTHTRVEVDHKHGRSKAINDISDYQALCYHCNKVKRERCKVCKETGIRFDAKTLGYPISYTKGNRYYDASVNGCEGCFLYDLVSFRSVLKTKA